MITSTFSAIRACLLVVLIRHGIIALSSRCWQTRKSRSCSTFLEPPLANRKLKRHFTGLDIGQDERRTELQTKRLQKRQGT